MDMDMVIDMDWSFHKYGFSIFVICPRHMLRRLSLHILYDHKASHKIYGKDKDMNFHIYI